MFFRVGNFAYDFSNLGRKDGFAPYGEDEAGPGDDYRGLHPHGRTDWFENDF